MHVKFLIFFCIALIIFAGLGCANYQEEQIAADAEYYSNIASNDVKLAEPRSGEWLYTNNEKGKSFSQYKSSNPVRAGFRNDVIYLLPIGYFNKLQSGILESVRAYIEIYFQHETVLLERILDNTIPPDAQRTREDNNVQLLAPYILDTILKKKMPGDALALMAITEKDLYPKSDWNYVFGLASYSKRIGVSSIYRLQNIILDTSNYKLCLKRLINISSHEISHMLTLHHCIHAKCTMNGTNSIYETDLSPNRLCSECQQKLQWSCGYDNEKRLTELIAFFEKHNLAEDLQLVQKDFAILNSIQKDE